MHWRHEQLSLRMALAAATHHSAQPRGNEERWRGEQLRQFLLRCTLAEHGTSSVRRLPDLLNRPWKTEVEGRGQWPSLGASLRWRRPGRCMLSV